MAGAKIQTKGAIGAEFEATGNTVGLTCSAVDNQRVGIKFAIHEKTKNIIFNIKFAVSPAE